MSDAIIERRGRAFVCPRCGQAMEAPDCANGCDDQLCPAPLLEEAWHQEQERLDPRDPDHTRPGIFADHNCWKCNDGKTQCANGNPARCDYPSARND